jgi:hypothetical protein
VSKEPIFSRNPGTGALGKALAGNVPLHPIAAPLFIGQGLADTVVVPSAQKTYVDAMCKAGQQLEYRSYKGYDHVRIVPRAELAAHTGLDRVDESPAQRERTATRVRLHDALKPPSGSASK